MDYIQPEHQSNNYFMGAFDYPFWQEDEPWDGLVESRNPEFSIPFHQSPRSSFDGAMYWVDGYETLYYTHSPVSTVAITPPVATATNATKPKLVETQAQPQEPPNPNLKQKRKRTQIKAITKSTTNSNPKRVCRSRSTSFSPRAISIFYNHDNNKVDHEGNDSNDDEKEGVYLEQSRVASNKFRERKRNEIAQLELNEYDSNRRLHSTLDSLKSEILSLKMQLLQHTDCNCELIQAYITKEAQHFVKSLEGVVNA